MWSHRIYSSLVTGNDDFVGKVAYSKYKQEKLDWINNHKKGHSGQSPSNEQLDEFFYPTYNDQKTIKRLREAAERDLQDLMQLTLSEELKKNREEILKDEILKSVKTPLRTRITDGMISSILATFLLTLLSLGLWLLDQKESDASYQGPVETFKNKILPAESHSGKSAEE